MKNTTHSILIQNPERYAAALRKEQEHPATTGYMDFADIAGQEGAKRALEIAAAGGHNILLVGAPGSGKSTLARALAGILPPITHEESTATSKIWSVAGKLDGHTGLLRQRPFRAPHSSTSLASILGGGSGENVMPGEVSLANGGVLFLDDFAETPRSVLEALRGPMEDRRVTITRLRSKTVYPASFMLVAASNPCPCGYYGEGDRCTCSAGMRTAYLSKLSGPVMDKIDLQVWIHPTETSATSEGGRREPSAAIAERVARARAFQERRLGKGRLNADMTASQTDTHCRLGDEENLAMEKLITGLGLSVRSYTHILKVARTIADLDGSPDIKKQHIAEAAGFRFLDRRDQD